MRLLTGLSRDYLERRCATLADELLMNAIYDAPRDGAGNPKL